MILPYCIMIRFKLFRNAWGILRPRQAYKAAIVFAPAVFHGSGAIGVLWPNLLRIALAWFLASGVVYIFNDLHDLAEDRGRPERASRPLVKGDISPGGAKLLAFGLLAILLVFLLFQPRVVAFYTLGYIALNIAYTCGLKKQVGLQQALVAVGFWMRLKCGAEPVVPVHLTAWAAIFTLGLAYFLNALKLVGRRLEDTASQWLGVGLAGALALVSLTTLCIFRGIEGTLRHPEWPPLLCLVCMHRVAADTFRETNRQEQGNSFFKDKLTIACLAMFTVIMLMGL